MTKQIQRLLPSMASSLAEECTPLKHKYDACFNAWFEGYLEPIAEGSSPDQQKAHQQAKAKEYEDKCGIIWESYKQCVQVCHIVVQADLKAELSCEECCKRQGSDHPLGTSEAGRPPRRTAQYATRCPRNAITTRSSYVHNIDHILENIIPPLHQDRYTFTNHPVSVWSELENSSPLLHQRLPVDRILEPNCHAPNLRAVDTQSFLLEPLLQLVGKHKLSALDPGCPLGRRRV